MASIKEVREQLRTAAVETVSRLKIQPDESKILSLVDAVITSVPEATEDQVRRALRKAVRQKFNIPRSRSGSPPNANVVLSVQEIAFIKRSFGGSPSRAIHAGLALLMEQERRR